MIADRERIDFNVPPFVEKAMKYIQEAVDNRKICGDGSFTKKCSEWIEQQTKTTKCLLTTSCTHATEMAALLADIKPGDEVILPSYTFVSTADAFVLRGATVVFVDIRPDTMNIDETLIEEAITERTKVIVPVHYAGVGCEMDTIMEIADRHNLLVVEDAAQGIMASYKGKALGTFGSLAVLVSMKRRISVWVKAARCLSGMKSILKMPRFSVKKERTGANITEDKLISTAGRIMVPPICQAI